MTHQNFDKQGNTGFTHLINATRFSLQGLRACFVREAAFRHELALFTLLIPASIYCAQNPGQVIALICVCLLALAVELLNSGIEAAIDRLGDEHHEMSGLAKDYGSAATMMALGVVALVFGYILWGFFQG